MCYCYFTKTDTNFDEESINWGLYIKEPRICKLCRNVDLSKPNKPIALFYLTAEIFFEYFEFPFCFLELAMFHVRNICM